MAAVLLTASPAFSQAAARQEYLFEHWQLEDGLPQITSLALAQDGRGYLWIGTEEGVARFDGLRFVSFDRNTTPGLRHNVVEALLAARDGALWIGTRDGLHRYEDGRITALTTEDGLADNWIRALCEDRQGRLWVGSDTGLSRFEGAMSRSWTSADGLPASRVQSLAEDGQGVMWIGTEGGLVREVEEDGEVRFEPPEGLPAGTRVQALQADGWQDLWAGTDAGLFQLRKGRVVRSIRDELDHPSVLALFKEAGNLWIGTGAGLSRLSSSTGDLVTLWKGEIRALLGDREGGLWIGTRFDGLLRARRRRISGLGTSQGLPDPLTLAVFEDRQETLWVGGRGGLTRFDAGGTVVTYTVRDGLPESFVGSIYEDRNGTLWVGTQSRGGATFRQGRFQAFPLSGRLVEPRVTRFLEDPEGGLWVATIDGIYRRGEQGWRPFSQNDELPGRRVIDLHFDGEGILWIATGDGLASWRDGVVTSYQEGFASLYLLSFHEAEDGTLWIGTWGGGLSRFKGGEVRSVSIHPSLTEVHRILDDGRGNFWMSGNRGIFRVEKAGLERLFQDPPGEGPRLAWFDETDGMPSRECNGGNQPAGWRRRDGTLCFPTIRGVAIVDPSRLGDDAPLPIAVIEQVRADQRSLDLRSEPVLPPETRVLDFYFAAPDFTAPRKVRYRIRLDGFDLDWIDVTDRRSATYTNLRPGEYTFRVNAGRATGEWGREEDAFTFRIEPAFYQTRRFWAASTLFLTVLAWGAYRYRISQLLKASQLRMLEAKSAEMEHFLDTVAHDLKSPLFTVRGFLGHLEKDLKDGAADRVESDLRQIRSATEKMSHMVEELLELSRLGRIESRPEDVAASELVAEALDAVAGRIDERGVLVDVAPELPVLYGDRSRLVQVLQNLIENAVKYMGSQEAPRIEIRGRCTGDEDVLSVRDNGMGIDPERLDEIFELFTKLDAASDGSGVGLALVHRVVELHGGRVWAESEGMGRGTTFFVALPQRSRA